jgi:hypothetical protein
MPLQTKSSYVTTDEADAYFQGRLQTGAWDSATQEDKQKALIQATTAIDNLAFEGRKLDPQQELEFPRFAFNYLLTDLVYDGNIPFTLKYGVCEQALALLNGFDAEKEINSIQVNMRSMGEVKTHYDRSTVPQHLACGICAVAWPFLFPLLRDPRNIRIVKEVSHNHHGYLHQ